MKKVTLLTLVLIAFVSANAQITFQETIIGSGSFKRSSVVQTNDSGFAILSSSSINACDSSDIYLVKTDSLGILLWTKKYGGAGNDYGTSINKTSDGGFIIAGNTNSFGAGGYDLYIIKTDSLGDTLWSKTYGGIGDDAGWSTSVMQISNGNYIIVGSTKSYGQGNNDVYLIKTNSIGDTLWTRTYGDSLNNQGCSVKPTANGGFIIVGTTYIPFVNPSLAYLIKTDSTGNLVWSQSYGNTANGAMGYSVFAENDGGFVLSGQVSEALPGTFTPSFLLKTDSIGNFIWGHCYSPYYSSSSIWNFSGNTTKTNDGCFVIGGSNGFPDWAVVNPEDPFIAKVDSNGNQIWLKIFGQNTHNEFADFVIPTSDRGFALIGRSEVPSFKYNLFLVKTDSAGNSGCNQPDSTFNVDFFTPDLFDNSLAIQSSGCILHSPPTQVTSGAGSASDYCMNIGISETNTPPSTLEISPNPATSEIKITTTNSIMKEAHIYTMMGQCILQSTINNRQSTIDISSLPPGMYIAEVISEKGVIRKKFVKE